MDVGVARLGNVGGRTREPEGERSDSPELANVLAMMTELRAEVPRRSWVRCTNRKAQPKVDYG